MRAKLYGLAFGACLALLLSAAPARAQDTPDVTFNVDTTTNGATTTTTYHLSRSALNAIGWQFGQYWRGAETQQALGQGAGAVCLTPPEQASTPPNVPVWNYTAPIPNWNLDWTVNRVRNPHDGAILSVVPVTGAVYRNAIRLGGATVSKLCLYGDIYGKSKSTGAWFRWVGVSTALPTGWQIVPNDVDATVLN